MATTRKKVSAKAPVKTAKKAVKPAAKVVKKTAVKKTTAGAKPASPSRTTKASGKKTAAKAPAKKSVKAKKAATLKKTVAKAAKAGKAVAPKRELKPSTKAPTKSVKKTAAGASGRSPVKAVPKAAVKVAPKKVAPKKAAPKKVVKKAAVKAAPITAGPAKKKPIIQLAPKVKKTATPKAKAFNAPVAAPSVPAVASALPSSTETTKALKGLKVGGALGARIAQIVAESARQHTAPVSDDVREELTDISRPVASGKGKDADPVDVAHKAAALLFAKKAEDMVLLDLRNLSTVADYYLICTCHNEPQMRAMLNDVQRTLSREGIKSLRSEYMSGVRWAIIDYGDLIIHLFEAQTRGYYSLERLWADAPSTRLKAEDYALATESDSDEDDDL